MSKKRVAKARSNAQIIGIIFVFYLKIFDILGTTGFDSKVSEIVSIPRTEMKTRKTYFNNINGENNFALAA